MNVNGELLFRKGVKMRNKVLHLYKELLRYGETLRFTDKKYYRFRIRKGFLENKDLSDPKSIKFFIKVKKLFNLQVYYAARDRNSSPPVVHTLFFITHVSIQTFLFSKRFF